MHEVERLYKETFSKDPNEALSSPPDIFAVCCYFAKISGVYVSYAKASPKSRALIARAETDGREWRLLLDKAQNPSVSKFPNSVSDAWRLVGSSVTRSLEQLSRNTKFVEAVLFLIAAADEACAGVGIPTGVESAGTPGGYFEFLTEVSITEKGTLCRCIPASSIRVLPKQHTPQSGFNIRSLTHHLALCSASEVKPVWTQIPSRVPPRTAFNILLAPWPLHMDASDIRPGDRKSKASPDFGYFDYSPNHPVSDAKVLSWMKRVLDAAVLLGQHIDLIIFPECALTHGQWKRVSKLAAERGAAIIAGVRSPPSGDLSGGNSLRVRFPFSQDFEIVQNKHHRWQIESSQITNYGLGGTLCVKKSWWENIGIEPRELNFIALRPELVLCPLICEDLARQDPVSELVRSVGPNLVVALLMDGPQIAERWSAKYASVLADDPGSSVLTLSSLGMVQLSRPASHPLSRTFASWKDAAGNFVPLSLQSGEEALIINLQFQARREWTVDGRNDGQVASTPVLCGVQPVSLVS